MNSKKYYLDEIKDPGSNYAAASDILRAEILYDEGGVYFDAEDVFPENPLGQLYAEKGILIHCFYNDAVNNDLIGSVPNGEIIGKFRNQIQKNYEELYRKDQRYLMAHRFSNFSSFRTGDEDRRSSTMRISGPVALRKITDDLYKHDRNLAFPERYWKIPQRQALSWLDTDFSSIEKVAPYFRHNLIE